MKPLIAQCRRAYFAICKALGFDDDFRHEFNRENVGKESSTAWTEADWLLAVSLLQIASGRPGVEPGKPHLKGIRYDVDLPFPLDAGPTQIQLRALKHLAASKMRDAECLISLIRRRAFKKDQATAEAQWKGTLETLPRDVAGRAILVLHRLREKEAAAGISLAAAGELRE